MIQAIKPQDLRIGNWVQHKYFKHPSQVTADAILAIEQGSANYNPIPLSLEILEKAGFENRLNSSIWSLGRFEIYLNEEKLFKYDIFGHKPVTVRYLHNLQNIYFSLFGQELTIEI